MTHTADILLFGTMGTIGPEIRRRLADRGLRVESVPFPQNTFNDEPGYRRTLVRAIAEYKPAFVFPVGNTVAISRFKTLVNQGVALSEVLCSHRIEPGWEEAVKATTIVVEKEETITLLDSKVQFYTLAEHLALPRPGRYLSIEDIPSGAEVVFKRDVSFGGHGVHRPKNIESLKNLISKQKPGEPFLIEEYIEGQDYSLDTVRYGGTFKAGGYESISYRVSGPSEQRRILPAGHPILMRMESIAKTILEYISYQGVCGFDFRADKDGGVYLIECNPRFTGGIASQAEAGFDIAWTIYSIIKNGY